MSYVNKLKAFWHKNPYFFQVVPLVLLIMNLVFDGLGHFVAMCSILGTLFYIYQSKEITNQFDRRTQELTSIFFKYRS